MDFRILLVNFLSLKEFQLHFKEKKKLSLSELKWQQKLSQLINIV